MSEEPQNDGSKKSPSLAASNDGGMPGAEWGAQVDASTHTSQTSVAQMTASAAPTEGHKWRCESCTYENFPLSRKCTMCRTQKPSLGEDIFRLQDGASALPTQDVCGAEAIAERLKPLRISSPQGQAGASSVTKWPCATCTYENWPRSLKCAMCGAPPPRPLDHAAAAIRPAQGINDICNSQNASLHDADPERRRSKRRNNPDWIWLQACLGVVEDDARCVEAYLAAGGDPARALTAPEVALLNRASAFDPGHTLVHLAIRFQRQEILSTLLSRISGGGPGLKRSPSYVAPDLATAIRRHVASCVRHKKGVFPCRYINEFCTFSLPAEIEELPAAIQEQLFSELLDREAQQTLEADPPLINWSLHLTVALGSRLYALWNRSAGDCLPDAVCQAAYGVSDRANVLRGALGESLQHAQRGLYARWAAWERLQAGALHYQPEEAQLRGEWARLAAAAARPGAALHQLHVFALAHVMRRPILVYGVDVVNSFRGEALGYARFQGERTAPSTPPAYTCRCCGSRSSAPSRRCAWATRAATSPRWCPWSPTRSATRTSVGSSRRRLKTPRTCRSPTRTASCCPCTSSPATRWRTRRLWCGASCARARAAACWRRRSACTRGPCCRRRCWRSGSTTTDDWHNRSAAHSRPDCTSPRSSPPTPTRTTNNTHHTHTHTDIILNRHCRMPPCLIRKSFYKLTSRFFCMKLETQIN